MMNNHMDQLDSIQLMAKILQQLSLVLYRLIIPLMIRFLYTWTPSNDPPLGLIGISAWFIGSTFKNSEVVTGSRQPPQMLRHIRDFLGVVFQIREARDNMTFFRGMEKLGDFEGRWVYLNSKFWLRW